MQEWVEGPDHGIYFCLFYCDAAGKPLRIFTGRKLSAFPPGVGSTATCIAAPRQQAQLEALTERLTRAVGFAGMGGLEFKRNEITGEFVIIEPTVVRTDWQEEIATLSGVNIPVLAAAMAFARGRPVAAVLSACGNQCRGRSPWAYLVQRHRDADGLCATPASKSSTDTGERTIPFRD